MIPWSELIASSCFIVIMMWNMQKNTHFQDYDRIGSWTCCLNTYWCAEAHRDTSSNIKPLAAPWWMELYMLWLWLWLLMWLCLWLWLWLWLYMISGQDIIQFPPKHTHTYTHTHTHTHTFSLGKWFMLY